MAGALRALCMRSKLYKLYCAYPLALYQISKQTRRYQGIQQDSCFKIIDPLSFRNR